MRELNRLGFTSELMQVAAFKYTEDYEIVNLHKQENKLTVTIA